MYFFRSKLSNNNNNSNNNTKPTTNKNKTKQLPHQSDLKQSKIGTRPSSFIESLLGVSFALGAESDLSHLTQQILN